ncbi:MAG TPA: putative sugar nucleotidyl transferase [Gemmatimonadales bacterium]|nr:putative sugar nucleotidyl transferase [Gemmatimonadales bacterium]
MSSLYLLEPDRPGATWAPFAGVRPIGELRAGIWRIRERWEQALGVRASGIVGAHCELFSEDDEPPVVAASLVRGPAVVAASWFAPSLDPLRLGPDTQRVVHQRSTVAWVLPAGAGLDSRSDAGPAVELDGVLLAGTFALLDARDRLLRGDCERWRSAGRGAPPGGLVLGDPADVICRRATVEPGVVFDVRNGPVVLDEGAEVRHGARIEGPTYVGPGSRVLGGEVRGSVFGPVCRVRGEIAETVFLGWANKAHDGFVGHSVVGRWANLGAGTITSNLKNTYGPVRLDVAGERIDTGRLNVGTLAGDHVKTAIGTLLGTGTVIGAGASVFGAGAVPKYVPPFAWGLRGERMTEEGFLRIAERIMARRDVALTPARRESLRRAWVRATGSGR